MTQKPSTHAVARQARLAKAQYDALVGDSNSNGGGSDSGGDSGGGGGGGGSSGVGGSGGGGGGGSGGGGGGRLSELGLRELKWGQAVLLSRAHAGTGKPLALVGMPLCLRTVHACTRVPCDAR